MSTSFSSILESMKAKYAEVSGMVPSEDTDLGIRLQVVASQLFELYSRLEYARLQTFPHTASGSYLSFFGDLAGIKKKAPSKATGTLSFSRDSASSVDIAIPKGTVCTTSGTKAVRYSTNEDAVLPAGELSVTVSASSLETGSQCNAFMGTVTVMISPIPGILYVTNPTPFTGASDGENDESFRSKILSALRTPSFTGSRKYYMDLIRSIENVKSCNISESSVLSGAYDVFIDCNENANTSLVLQNVSDALSEQAHLGFQYGVSLAQTVTLVLNLVLEPAEGVHMITAQAACDEALRSYVNNRPVGRSISLPQLYNAILSCPEIANAEILEPASGFAVDGNQVAKLGTVTYTNW